MLAFSTCFAIDRRWISGSNSGLARYSGMTGSWHGPALSFLGWRIGRNATISFGAREKMRLTSIPNCCVNIEIYRGFGGI